MMQQFDKMFPDYLGSRPGQRTQAADYYDKHPEELPSMEQFCRIFASWLQEYHNAPKGGAIHAGRSPREIWETRPRTGRTALSPERLRMAFLRPEAVRTVGRGPGVKWNNDIFYCDSLVWGDKVLVKTDTLDPGHVMCFRLDGSFIGEARTRAALHALAAGKDEIRAMMARQRRQLREARTCIDSLTGGSHLYSPLELLLAEPGAAGIKAADRITSVKGAAHQYEHHQIAGVIEQPASPDPQTADDSRDREDREAALEAEAFLARPGITEEEPNDLADIHNFITNHKKGEDEE